MIDFWKIALIFMMKLLGMLDIGCVLHYVDYKMKDSSKRLNILMVIHRNSYLDFITDGIKIIIKLKNIMKKLLNFL